MTTHASTIDKDIKGLVIFKKKLDCVCISNIQLNSLNTIAL